MDEKITIQQHRLFQSKHQTLSRLLAYEAFDEVNDAIWILELPNKNNEKWVSCIPADLYEVIPWNSPTFGKCFKITKVKNRTDILIHKGNFAGSKNPKTGTEDTNGCQLPGFGIADFEKDGHVEVTSSNKCMNKLLETYPDGFYLDITERFMNLGEVPKPSEMLLSNGEINTYSYSYKIDRILKQSLWYT